MLKVFSHHSAETLLALSKRSTDGRVSVRLLVVRDRMLGVSQKEICKRYGIDRSRITHWINRYNAGGVEALKDSPRSGAPCKILPADQEVLKARIAKGPDQQKDGLVRWRAVDVQQLLKKEFNAHYTTVQGVRRLLHSLGLAPLTTRPTHPKRSEESTAEFKKNSARNSATFNKNIQKKRSNSGAKTKRASAKKAGAVARGASKARDQTP